MKRRNFLKTLIGAAAAVVLPASAMRDILIHKGNRMMQHGCLWTKKLYPYQHEAIRQINLYQHASRVVFSAPRQLGKTYWLQLGNAYHSQLEKRVLALLDTKQKRA